MSQEIIPQENMSMLEKMVNTWVKKNYIFALKNPNDKRQLNSEKNCSRFILSKLGRDTDEKTRIKFATKAFFKKAKANTKIKLYRISKHQKIQEIQSKYPKLDIENAYKYLVLENKFAVNSTEIKNFETLIEILFNKFKN